MTRTEERKKARQEAKKAVLLSEDPFFEPEDEMEHLGNTMKAVHDFINASLEMDMNPLPHLRKYFPGFKWEFFRGEKKDRFVPSIGEKVRCADYIWHTYNTLRDTGEIFIARQIGRNNPRMLFYVSSQKHDILWSWTKDIREVVPKVRFVFYENGNLQIEEGAQ